MATLGTSLRWGALCAALVATCAWAAAEPRPLAGAVSQEIASCVDASTIRFARADRHVLMDAADTQAVSAAIARRYPAVQRDGLLPRPLVLWKKPDTGWVFVALLANPSSAGQVCFTATFSAAPFPFTPDLVEKYFGAQPGLAPEQTLRAGGRSV